MGDRSTVLLGFVDEPITDNYKEVVDHTTNKLGGLPDWITARKNPKIKCKICKSVTPLLLQIYAPVSERINHDRTLYIFGCLTPTCWGMSKSWTCIKNQILIKKTSNESFVSNFSNEDWCTDANNWNFDSSNKRDSSLNTFLEEEATSMLSRVTVSAEENANLIPDKTYCDFRGAVASAEIEPDENEPIMVDSPTIPHCDVLNMLKQVPTSPKIYRENIYFIPSFIYVMEEKLERDPLLEHVQILLTKYNKLGDNKNSLKVVNNVNASQQFDEKYEKSGPLHGDKLFHTFLSRIKSSPDQIIRYCRSNDAPLFLYPESDVPTKCKNCNAEMVFEIQILPTVINYLRLNDTRYAEKDTMEFGSVFIYSCRESCDKPDEEECVLVQSETF